MSFWLWSFAGGLFGTFLMDIAERRLASFGFNGGITGPLLGRWVRGLARGRVFVTEVRELPAWEGEERTAVLFHYLVGGGMVALGYPAFFFLTGFPVPASHWLAAPAYGLLTVFLAWFVQYPAFGWGVFGRRAPEGSRTLATPLCLHAAYGIGIAAVLTVAAVGQPGPGPGFPHYQQQPDAYRLVEVLSGKSNDERRALVARTLITHGIAYRIEPYDMPNGGGANVIAEAGKGGRILVIAAHFDRVPGSPGANDNASCVAAAIEALRVLWKQPPPGLAVRFLFSDDEEYGLLGASAHILKNGTAAISGMVSLELCGNGDAFGLWDVSGPAKDSAVVRAFREAGKAAGIYNGVHGRVPRYGSDHRAFAAEGVAAVGLTVLPKADERTLRDYVADPNRLRWILPRLRPTIFQTYHSPADGPQTVQPESLEMTAGLIVRAVRIFAKLSHSG